ncbi:hypothetical protein [Paenibacillus sediminis]
MRGNLAVKEKSSERVSQRYRETTKVVTRRSPLPMKEKLVAILTVMVCVAIAGLIIWRYALIYDLNMQIQNADRNITDMKQQVTLLQLQKQKLEDRIAEEAVSLGYVTSDGQQVIDVSPRMDGTTAEESTSKKSVSSSVAQK